MATGSDAWVVALEFRADTNRTGVAALADERTTTERLAAEGNRLAVETDNRSPWLIPSNTTNATITMMTITLRKTTR